MLPETFIPPDGILWVHIPIKQYILDTAIKLAKIRYDLVISNQNRLIEKVIRYVQENMDDEELSLQLIASKILYLNVDYLGKLFKKETGMRFSQYLLQVRMEKAKELIKASSSDIKIYEIAKATGFANKEVTGLGFADDQFYANYLQMKYDLTKSGAYPTPGELAEIKDIEGDFIVTGKAAMAWVLPMHGKGIEKSVQQGCYQIDISASDCSG